MKITAVRMVLVEATRLELFDLYADAPQAAKERYGLRFRRAIGDDDFPVTLAFRPEEWREIVPHRPELDPEPED